MEIEFDPAKDTANIEKHGVSLARAVDLEIISRVKDERYDEDRRRAYGLIDGAAYCLAFTVRNGRVRAISLRRATQRRCAAMSDKPIVFDDDNPEWTDADFARAVPASQLDEVELAAFPRTRGRPPGSTAETTKQQVSLRLDRDVIRHFRSSGPGWQSRINQALRRAMG